MLILTKRKFRFVARDKGAIKDTFTSKGGSELETAPDWIADTVLFNLAVKDGLLVRTDSAPIISAAEPKPAAKKTAVKKKA